MTSGDLKSDFGVRVGAVLLSGAAHLAAGLALLHANHQGARVRDAAPEDAGPIVMIELVRANPSRTPTGDYQGSDRVRADVLSAAPPPGRAAGGGAPDGASPGLDVAVEPPIRAGSGETAHATDVPASEILAYRQRLESHLARYRIYPSEARATGRQGTVTVHFVMTQDGGVLNAWVEASSGVSDLDAEALGAILRAQPLPPPPQGWPARVDVSLPVTFRLG